MHELSLKIEPLLADLGRLESELAQPNAAQRGDYIERTQRYAQLKAVFELDQQLNQLAARIEDAKKLKESDPELRALAESELEEAAQSYARVQSELVSHLVPHDPQDEQNAIVEIRAGTGGEESALFAGDLTRMYQKFAEKRSWRVEIIDGHPTELGGFKQLTFIVQGRGAYGAFKFESGVHRVQRVPRTESSGRIHTSTATVAVLPEVDEVEVQIKPEEIRVDVFRAGGPGGQSVNTTDSAVRVTHLPTGIIVICQDQKSQHKNKAKAMRVLQSRLKQRYQDEQQQQIAQQRRIQIGSAARSEKIRTYNFPQNRITDHRIELTTHRLEQILKEGELHWLIEPLMQEYLEEQMATVKP